jgi:hypothetical protein
MDNDLRWYGSDSYFVTPTAKSGDLYFNVETYFYGVMQSKCHPIFGLPPYLTLKITQNGETIVQSTKF